ncbi:MAG: GAF domain-containing protein [Deltaproteobacteria bacterium]|nr:GAF domain-containing protein [Deltaproteobacteria bacterium]
MPDRTKDPEDRLIQALTRITSRVQSQGDLSPLLRAILDEARHLLGCEAASLLLYDEGRHDLCFEVVVGGDERIRFQRVPMDKGIAGVAAVSRRAIVVPDASKDARHLVLEATRFPTRDLVAVPMLQGDTLIGVIEALNKKQGSFDEMDARILGLLADQAAMQIVTTRLFDEKLRGERLAALGTAVAGIAHHIKNILAQAQGSATLVDLGLTRSDLSLVAEAWPLLRDANERMSRLVGDLLGVAHLEAPQRRPVDLGTVVREVLDAEQDRALRAGAGLEADLGVSPTVLADPTQLHDMLLNLVGNAIEAIESNGRPGTVWVRTRPDASPDRVLLEVEDDGPGIPPELHKRIFEPLFTTRPHGHGFGLAMVARAVREHGGEIRLASTPGRGSTFTLSLPTVVGTPGQ